MPLSITLPKHGVALFEISNVQNTAPVTQLLANPGFESGTSSWSNRFGGTFTVVNTGAHTPTYASKIAGRTGQWVGVNQNILSILNANGKRTYTVSAWVKLGSGN